MLVIAVFVRVADMVIQTLCCYAFGARQESAVEQGKAGKGSGSGRGKEEEVRVKGGRGKEKGKGGRGKEEG